MTIKDLKSDTHELYKRVGSLWCKAVKDNVVFNRYGWIHLTFRSGGQRRLPKDIKLRYYLFTFVHEIVSKSRVVFITEGSITSKRKKSRNVKYYELVYLFKKDKLFISVVLRRIEQGKLHYYSVRRASNKIKKALIKTGLL